MTEIQAKTRANESAGIVSDNIVEFSVGEININ